LNDGIPAGFEPLLDVGSLLSSLTVPWWIGGGWAIDLAAGRPTRPHDDIDVVLLERDQHALRTDLPGVDLLLMTPPDHREQPWPPGRRLTAGPDRVRLRSSRLSLPCEVLFDAAVGSRWVYHRGQPAITLPLSEAGRQRYGIPFLAPEVVLVTKAVFTRDKDQQDFESALPFLGARQRQWLRDGATMRWRSARRRAGDPDAEASEHPWTARLTETAGPAGMIHL
jgi:aminoglycoside-2''-adenylyltransferase